MKRRSFLIGAAGVVGVALGRSMVTVPGFWSPGEAVYTGRLVSIDDAFGYEVGDYIRRSDGLLYRIIGIERDSPVGAEVDIVEPVGFRRRILGEVAIAVPGEVVANRRLDPSSRKFARWGIPREMATAEPVVEVRTLRGDLVDGQMRIYRHNFEHDGRYFHVGTSRPYDPTVELPSRETWHPSFWEKTPTTPDPDPWVRRNLGLI